MPIVSVLWALALLSAAALSLVAAGRVEYVLAHDAIEVASDDAVAEAVTDRAVLALLDPRPVRRWRTDGVLPENSVSATAAFASAYKTSWAASTSTKRTASLLFRLIESAGIDADAAEALVEKILDWRDTSPLRRLERREGARISLGGLCIRTAQRTLSKRRRTAPRDGNDARDLRPGRGRPYGIFGPTAFRPARRARARRCSRFPTWTQRRSMPC